MKVVRRGTFRGYFTLELTLMIATGMFAASSIYEFTLPSIEGKPTPLETYKG